LNQYLLDTNICIYYIKGSYNLKEKFWQIGPENCFISEITLAELKYGVANSQHQQKNQQALSDFLSGIQIIPVFKALDTYAAEKARLRREGNLIDDFDLLIGSTAVTFDMIMVTNNTKHFSRIDGIQLEDWT
jgi:tRNA(fMet)-specific endonuclease VapC